MVSLTTYGPSQCDSDAASARILFHVPPCYDESSNGAFARSVCRLVMATSIKVRAPRRSVLAASGLLGSGPVLTTTTSRARSGVYSQP